MILGSCGPRILLYVFPLDDETRFLFYLMKIWKRREKGPIEGPGAGGSVVKPHARFSRLMGRLAKIFDLNLRIYSLLEDEPRLRYRPSLLLNLAIALILAGPEVKGS